MIRAIVPDNVLFLFELNIEYVKDQLSNQWNSFFETPKLTEKEYLDFKKDCRRKQVRFGLQLVLLYTYVVWLYWLALSFEFFSIFDFYLKV